jgi:hypothetical protein
MTIIETIGWYIFPLSVFVRWRLSALASLAFAGGLGIGTMSVRSLRRRRLKPKAPCSSCKGLRVVQTCVTDISGLELWPCPSCGTWADVTKVKNQYGHS